MTILKMTSGVVRSSTIPRLFEQCLKVPNPWLKGGLPIQALQVRHKSQSNGDNSKFGSRPKGDNSKYGFANWQQKKDFHRRECVRDHFAERMRINTIRKNNILPLEIREAADKDVEELKRDSNPIRLVPRCVFTSRPRGVRIKYRTSRIVFRSFADVGQVAGFTRSSW